MLTKSTTPQVHMCIHTHKYVTLLKGRQSIERIGSFTLIVRILRPIRKPEHAQVDTKANARHKTFALAASAILVFIVDLRRGISNWVGNSHGLRCSVSYVA